MTAADFFRRTSLLLEHAEIPYMLTGAFASSVYGMGRGSPDLDFVVGADEEGVKRLLWELPEAGFYSELSQVLDAYCKRSTFNILDSITGLKIDFILLQDREFSRVEFERRRKLQVWDSPLYVATPEDVLLSSLEWAKLKGFGRQIEDTAGILKVRNDLLDRSYIGKWVQELNLTAQWSQARRLADLE